MELVLKPSTNRSRRSPDDDEYFFLDALKRSEHAWVISGGGNEYGYLNSEIEKASGREVAFIQFDPLNIHELESFIELSPIEVITIGLDTIADLAEQHSRVGGAEARKMSREEFDRALAITRSSDLVLRGDENCILRGTLSAKDVLTGRGGIVSEKHLTPLINAGALISKSCELASIKSASYDLRVGEQVWCEGQLVHLNDAKPTFTIPPYSYAIVTSKEEAWLPTFISGSFDIKVGLFLRGVILSNGPQIDPGYRGPLFCMLFNGSSDSRTIAREDHFATLQFQTVTNKSAPYKDKYQLQSKLERIMSEGGLSGQGGNIVREFNDRFGKIDSKVSNVNGLLISVVIAAIIAIVGIAWAQISWSTSESNRLSERAYELQEEFRSITDSFEREARQILREAQQSSLDSASNAALSETRMREMLINVERLSAELKSAASNRDANVSDTPGTVSESQD